LGNGYDHITHHTIVCEAMVVDDDVEQIYLPR
jgi:hypothetical protein